MSHISCYHTLVEGLFKLCIAQVHASLNGVNDTFQCYDPSSQHTDPGSHKSFSSSLSGCECTGLGERIPGPGMWRPVSAREAVFFPWGRRRGAPLSTCLLYPSAPPPSLTSCHLSRMHHPRMHPSPLAQAAPHPLTHSAGSLNPHSSVSPTFCH
ncbi:Uncharacterized protein DAT39_004566 [Clarias magur]|uniref:Uncharacterized protein n=1 Tax=Clarias magur TaxID=1594786 RepID=A0A8J4XFU0_CLAMG|nr:Uncharacterized protein DAT39_004566 [Clarias magur]